MLDIAASYYYDHSNVFHIKEVYVSDGAKTYILAAEENFSPVHYGSIPVEDLVKTQGVYPTLSFSDIRQYSDDDSRAFSSYLHKKLRNINLKEVGAEKALYDVVTNMGRKNA